MKVFTPKLILSATEASIAALLAWGITQAVGVSNTGHVIVITTGGAMVIREILPW